MNFITITPDNIEQEHICCSISDKKNQVGVQAKKSWLLDRIDEGLKFVKLDVRGKVFIEYMPAEMAWKPVTAPNYLHIHCLWSSGKYKGQGYGKELLAICEADAKAQNKAGIIVISANKKKPYLTDKRFYIKHGFEICDTAPPYFELLVKKLDKTAPNPVFNDCVRKTVHPSLPNGLVMYYTAQCPFTHYWVKEMASIAKSKGLETTTIQITNREDAQNCPSVFTTFGAFLNGKFLAHQIHGTSGFTKLLERNL